jgi:hypothetical protein
MADTPRPGPSKEQLDDLGLDEEDLGSFGTDTDDTPVGAEDQVGDQEATLATDAAPAGDEPTAILGEATDDAPAPPAAAAATTEPTPPAPTPGVQQEQQPPAAATAPSASPQAPNAPPAAPTAQPWTFAALGQRIPVEGATVEADGSVRLPATAVRQLQGRLGAHAQQLAQTYEQRLTELNPDNNRDVILSRLVIGQMQEALEKGGDDGLWDWIQGFRAQLPFLKERSARVEAETRASRYTQREQQERQQAEQAELEPQMQEAIGGWLERAIALPEYAELAGDRDPLAARLWAIRGELFKVAAQDDPEGRVQKGQRYLDLNVLDRELRFAADLVGRRKATAAADVQRAEAARRNAAALGSGPAVPPQPSVTGPPPAASAAATGRPKTREEWIDGLSKLAESPGL